MNARKDVCVERNAQRGGPEIIAEMANKKKKKIIFQTAGPLPTMGIALKI